MSWHALKQEELISDFIPTTRVSILIPCRNEAAHIAALLYDLSFQHYPKELAEIIVLDDFSKDETTQIARTSESKFGLSIINLSDHIQEEDSSKKQALTFGVAQANGDLIITVDADCRLHSNWLRSMVQYYETDKKKIFSGPILYDPVKGWMSTFEALDVSGTMIITGGMHRAKIGLLCNGANLAFEKKAFETVNGYEGKDHMVSGDDVFLMEKIAHRFPGSSGFLKSSHAIVRTRPTGKWIDFMNQRTRWASKNHQYSSKMLPIQLAIPVLLSWGLLLGIVLALTSVISFHYLWIPLVLKVLADLFLLWNATNYFKKMKWLIYFPVAEILHIIYLPLVSIRALIGRFTWKGRAY